MKPTASPTISLYGSTLGSAPAPAILGSRRGIFVLLKQGTGIHPREKAKTLEE